MPSIPIPQQVPIERAGWNTDFSPGGLLTPPSNERTPINPILSGLSQAETQAKTALAGAGAAQGIQDVQMKQRGMQASMLGALANLPPDQYETQKATTIGTINKLNPSWQLDPSMDQQTAKMASMSMVPVTEQPNYALNQSNAAINMALLKALGGQSAAATGVGGGMETPSPASSASPAAQPILGGGSSPAPVAGGMMTPQAEALLALAKPEASKALQGTPLYKQQVAASETSGKNTAEAEKNALEANEGFQQVKKTLESLKELIADPDLPQSTMGVGAKGQAWLSQNNPYGDQKSANAYNTFSTLNESQTINAIRDLASTGQIKMTRTLENIINKGYLIDPDVSPKAKLAQANAIETELENSAIAAQNVASRMSSGQGNTPYKTPYTAATQAQSKFPQNQQNQQSTPIITSKAAFDALPSGAIYVESDGNKYRKP